MKLWLMIVIFCLFKSRFKDSPWYGCRRCWPFLNPVSILLYILCLLRDWLQVFSRAFVEGVFKNQFYRQHPSFQSKLKWTRFQTRFESKANEQGECSCVLLVTVISSSLESRLHGQIPTFGIEVTEPWSEEDMRKFNCNSNYRKFRWNVCWRTCNTSDT